MGDVGDEIAPDLVDPLEFIGADVTGAVLSLQRHLLLPAFRKRFDGAPWLGFETVAESPRCVDVLVGRLLLQCCPDPAYVHVYRARGTDAGMAPDLLGERFAAPERGGGGGEGGGELEVGQAQRGRRSSGAGREGRRV